MNPMFAAALGSIIRSGLSFLAGYLVTRGIWTEQEATVYVIAAASGLTALLWGVYQKYGARVKLVTALATPGMTSETQLERVIDNTERRPPVTMQKDTIPYPVGQTNPNLPPSKV